MLLLLPVGSGSEFYFGLFYSSSYLPFVYIPSVLLMTTDTQPVSYYIEAPSMGYFRSGTLKAGNDVFLNLPRSVKVTSVDQQDRGLYLKINSTRVTVISKITGNNGGGTDTCVVFPVSKLCIEEYVYFGMLININPHILIVGIMDNTRVFLRVTQSVSIKVGNATTNLSPGLKHSFVINRLQTILIHANKGLTGTKVVTKKIVSVFSGHDCGIVPTGGGNCDYLIEQIPPTTLWSKVYYTAPLATRRAYTIKVLAAYDFTSVDIYCNNSKESYSIEEGINITISKTAQEYCIIMSNKQVLVAQFGHEYNDDRKGNSMMTLIPGIKQYSNKISTSTNRNLRRKNYKHFTNIVVLSEYYQPDMIHLISAGQKKSLDRQEWVPVRVNDAIEAYATKVNILDGVVEVIHSNPSAQMAAIVYGFALLSGYGHSGVVYKFPEG